MKKVIIILLLLGIAVGGYVFYFANKPTETAADKPSAYVVSATQLIEEFEQDEVSANNKYNNTTIEINGTIADIQINGENVDVTFELEDDFSNLNVQLISEMKSDLRLELGKPVKLKAEYVGVNTDLGIDVEFKQGIILK